MTLSAYFMSKSVFDKQGCRALTLALSRLSCNHIAIALNLGYGIIIIIMKFVHEVHHA